MDAAERIERWIEYKGKGFSQKELAMESGLSQSGLSMIMTHDRDPKTETLQKIVTALGLTMEQFWAGPEAFERSKIHARDGASYVQVDLDMGRIPLLLSIPDDDWQSWTEEILESHRDGSVPRYGVSGTRTFAIRIEGDEMVPDLYPGDLLLVNPEVPFTRTRGGIALIKNNGKSWIRKVYHMGDTYRLEPSNRMYTTETLPIPGTKIYKIALRISGQDEGLF